MKVLRSFALVAGGALALASPAAAHITVNPREAPADSFSRFAIRVPNERPTAATIALTVKLPEGLTAIGFQPKPGWTRSVTMAKLATPVQVEGETVTERIATVTWKGGSIGPGEFDEFGLSAHVPDTAGKQLAFPALQTYQGGEVVRWIGGPDADEPAPRVDVTAAASEDVAPTTRPAAASADDGGTDDSRANIALALAVAGLAAGLIALGVAIFRRPRTG
jgi:uncharacterized protein YcnI